MSRRLIIVDFDRTLFNVNEFFTDFCSQILSDEGVTNTELRAEVEEFLHSGNHSDFRPFMERYHVDLQGVMAKVNYTLSHKSYLYSDVKDFLARFKNDKVIIVSVGVQEYQEIKFQLTDSLSHIERVVIDANKGDYLKTRLRSLQRGIQCQELAGDEEFSELLFIDDKLDMLEPLAGQPLIKLFHIERPDAKFPSTSKIKGVQYIKTLEEVV